MSENLPEQGPKVRHQSRVAPSPAAPFVEAGLITLAPPITFRLPKAGESDPYFGAKRTFWNEHVLPNQGNGSKPSIKSVVVRKKGATRGIRFILYESALAFFQLLEAEQNPHDARKESQSPGLGDDATGAFPRDDSPSIPE